MKKTQPLVLLATVFCFCASSAHAASASGSRIQIINQAKGATADVKAATTGVAELQATLAAADAEIGALRADADRARARGPLESALAAARVAEAEDRARGLALDRLHKLTGDVESARRQLGARVFRVVGAKPDARIAQQLLSPEGTVLKALITGNRMLTRLQARLAEAEVRALARDLGGALRALDDSTNNLESHLDGAGTDVVDVDAAEPDQPELLRLIADRKSH